MAIQAANAANKTNPATAAANAIGNEVANPLYLQQASEAMLCPAALARLNKAAHIIERMLNQNTFDDIAQGNQRNFSFVPHFNKFRFQISSTGKTQRMNIENTTEH